jgi:hypothetical protein
LKILFLYQINTILYQIHLQTNFFITKSPFSHHFSHQNHLKNTIFLSKNTLKTTIFPSKITVLYQNPPFSYQIHIKTHHFYIKNHHFYIKITVFHSKKTYTMSPAASRAASASPRVPMASAALRPSTNRASSTP